MNGLVGMHTNTLTDTQREKVINVFTDPHPCDLTFLHTRAPLAHGHQRMAFEREDEQSRDGLH